MSNPRINTQQSRFLTATASVAGLERFPLGSVESRAAARSLIVERKLISKLGPFASLVRSLPPLSPADAETLRKRITLRERGWDCETGRFSDALCAFAGCGTRDDGIAPCNRSRGNPDPNQAGWRRAGRFRPEMYLQSPRRGNNCRLQVLSMKPGDFILRSERSRALARRMLEQRQRTQERLEISWVVMTPMSRAPQPGVTMAKLGRCAE
jgi:hypothetical protein